MNRFGKTIIAAILTGAISLTVRHYYEDSATKRIQAEIAQKAQWEAEKKAQMEYVRLRIVEAQKVMNGRSLAIAKETKLPLDVANAIVGLADKYDFYDETIVGVMNLESRYDPNKTNYNTNGTVDKGLMQINSGTLPWLAKMIGKPDANPYNPIDSLEMGVWYLNYLRNDICNLNMKCALDRYNGDDTGAYQAVVRERITQVASRMGIDRSRKEKP